jgi:aryl-alcohol dehydrogenase (NADP+)
MEYVRFGSTGLKVSRLCLGCMSYGTPQWRDWVLNEEQSRPILRRALDLGINFFDTADMYSLGVGEEVLGRALKDFGPARDRVVIATKLFFEMSDDVNDRGLSRKHIFDSIDKSLKRLGTDYVDLYQIHRLDPDTPMEETLEALNDLVRMGKVRYIGASAMWSWQFMKMRMLSELHGWAKFVSMQCYYNILYREQEREMLPMCKSEGIAVIPYSPLARGFVTGKYKRDGGGETLRAKTDAYTIRDYFHPADFDIVDRITQVASARGVSNIQVALAWILGNSAVTSPIVSATRPEQLYDLIPALSMKLTEEEYKILAEPYKPRKILGHV